MHKSFAWSAAKNETLKEKYGLGFERVLIALAEGDLLAERAHPNRERYAHQRQLVVRIDDYAWVVPFEQDETHIFLKTMFPSRQATAEYLKGHKL